MMIQVLIFFGLLSCAMAQQTTPTNIIQDTLVQRVVSSPTRSNLDMAAWYNNSLFLFPGAKIELLEGVVIEPTLFNMPWVDVHQNKQPDGAVFAFMPLRRNASIEIKNDLLADIHKDISSIKGVRISRLIVGKQLWIELQLLPGVEGKKIADINKDGLKEYWIQIKKDFRQDEQKNLKNYIEGNYSKEVLSSSAILEWAQSLASYWYPSLNTDIVWDLPKKDWKIGNNVVAWPTIVIKGNPLGAHHYTIISVPKVEALAQRNESITTTTQSTIKKVADRTLPQNYVNNAERFAKEQSELDADSAFKKTLAVQHALWKKLSDSLPSKQMGIEGANNWLYFKRSLNAIVGNKISEQVADKNPLMPLINFRQILEDNEINFLFVVVPNKEEVYPENLPLANQKLIKKIIYPEGRKFLNELQENGIEVIDLLPLYLQNRDATQLYQKEDTHWTPEGMLMAADLISKRISEYSWNAELANQKDKFSMQEATFTRLGDLVERIPETEQYKYKAKEFKGFRVYKSGALYAGPKGSPIAVIGDSFTGIMESTDCKNGGIAAHIARLSGIDTEVMTSWGGGPNVRSKFLRARKNQLENIRLVIYVMSQRDLYQYPDGWEP